MGYPDDPDDAAGFFANPFFVVSENGGRLYEFGTDGRHLRTLGTLTGATNLTFGYSAAGLLVSITDRFGNQVQIDRAVDGKPLGIVAPFGQRTDMVLDASGYLVALVNPATETNRFEYATGGLLTNVVSRRGNAFAVTYDAMGRALKVADPLGGYDTASRTNRYGGYTLVNTGSLARVSTTEVRYGEGGSILTTSTGPDGLSVESEENLDASRSTTTFPDGSVVEVEKVPDPRFGDDAKYVSRAVFTAPSGLSATTRVERTVVLDDPDDPLSLETMTVDERVNERSYSTTYDAATHEAELLTPEGRTLTLRLSANGQPDRLEVPGLYPINIEYDNSGRITSYSQGDGQTERRVAFGYNAAGFLSVVTNPLSQQIVLNADAIGRVTNVVRTADGQSVNLRYDAVSHLTGVKPPGKPEHTMDYSGTKGSVRTS